MIKLLPSGCQEIKLEYGFPSSKISNNFSKNAGVCCLFMFALDPPPPPVLLPLGKAMEEEEIRAEEEFVLEEFAAEVNPEDGNMSNVDTPLGLVKMTDSSCGLTSSSDILLHSPDTIIAL